MPVNYSSYRIRNAQRSEQWGALPDSFFVELGVSLGDIIGLQTQFQGDIVLPGNPDYDEDRKLSNPLFNYYPIMIAYCMVESDVSIALDFVRQQNLEFCLRSGGHCTAGFSSGPGVLIDVSNLNSIVVDAEARTVVVGCGVKFGDLNAMLNRYGLHVPGGECPDVCIGGYVQGGGYGFTSVTLGMNCDNVISMKVMLADGSVVEASRTRNRDLWWAMRGGTGGNFGILLSIKYHLYELTDVFGFALIWPLSNQPDFEQAADVMMLLQEQYMLDSQYGPELNLQVSLCYQSIINAGDPEGELKPYFMVRGLYAGSKADGMDAIAALQAMPGCYTQWTKVRRYEKMNEMLLNYPQGMPPITTMPNEDKACRYVKQKLTKEKWTEILAFFPTGKVNKAYMYLEFYGGKINESPAYESSFIHRDVAYNAVMDVFWYEEEDRPAAEKYLADWLALIEPVWNGHVYQNYPNLNAVDYAYKYWGYAAFALSLIKGKYDPDCLFSFAQMVPPIVYDGAEKPDEWQMPEALQVAFDTEIDFSGGIAPTPGALSG